MQIDNTLTLIQAQAIITAALGGQRSIPPRPIAVAVCDAGGHPLALVREAAAAPLLAHIALAKAFTCVVYGRETGELAAIADDYPTWFNGISRVAQASMGSPLAGSKGGLFIRGVDGHVLGAVGVAGETGETDVSLARHGLEIGGFLLSAAT